MATRDHHKATAELRALLHRKQGLLRMFGIGDDQLSDETRQLLDLYADYRIRTGMANLDESHLAEHGLDCRSAQLRDQLRLIQLRESNRRLLTFVNETQKEVQELRQFVQRAETTALPENERLREKQKTDAACQRVTEQGTEQQQGHASAHDLETLAALVDKVLLLEAKLGELQPEKTERQPHYGPAV